MDEYFADAGQSTTEMYRTRGVPPAARGLGHLPETQRAAPVLREMEALSYEQIADAMDTTVPSVKSLLVRARVGLAEATEARKLTCDEVRHELGEAAEGMRSLAAPVRRHVKECERCRAFRTQLRVNNRALAAIMPLGPLVLLKKTLLVKLGLATAWVAPARAAVRRPPRQAAASAAAGGCVAAATGVAGPSQRERSPSRRWLWRPQSRSSPLARRRPHTRSPRTIAPCRHPASRRRRPLQRSPRPPSLPCSPYSRLPASTAAQTT